MQSNDINVVIFWVCAAIGAVVYAAIIWSLVAYRKSKNSEASFHKHTATEIAWTVIPLLIIIAMTIPAAKLLTRLYGSGNAETDGGYGRPVSREGQEVVIGNPEFRPDNIHTDIQTYRHTDIQTYRDKS